MNRGIAADLRGDGQFGRELPCEDPARGAAPAPVDAPRAPRRPARRPGGVRPADAGVRQLIRVAREDPKVVAAETQGPLRVVPSVRVGPQREIDFMRGGSVAVMAVVDVPTRRVVAAWSGYAIRWQMARGGAGMFGRDLNLPWVWFPLCVIFLLGLLDYRRLRRVAHLDLLVVLSFGISRLLRRADIGVSVPLAYPPLVYLLARMLWVGFRGRGSGLRPSAPTALLAVLAVLLLGGRVALNVADSNVIDVGYAGVVGADQVTHGQPIYGFQATPVDNPTATPTVPSTTTPTSRSTCSHPGTGQLGRPAGRSRRRDRLRPADGLRPLCPRAAAAGAGRAGLRLGAILAFAWVGVPVHRLRARVELQRRPRGRALRRLAARHHVPAGAGGDGGDRSASPSSRRSSSPRCFWRGVERPGRAAIRPRCAGGVRRDQRAGARPGR